MKTSHLLAIAGCLAAAGTGLYAVLAQQGTTAAPGERVAGRFVTADRGDGTRGELAALRRDIAQLRQRLQARFGRDAAAGDRLRRLLDQVERLQRQVAELDQQARHSAAANTAGRSNSDPLAILPFTELDLELLSEERATQRREREAATEARFQAQPADGEWAAGTIELIEHALTSEALLDTEVFGVDCRVTACRLEVQHADAAAAERFALGFTTQVAEALPRVSFHQRPLAEGRIGTVLYLSREGHPALGAAQ